MYTTIKTLALSLTVLASSSALALDAASPTTGTGSGTIPAADAGNQAAIDDCQAAFKTSMQSEPKSSSWDAGPAGGALYHFHDAVWAFNVGDLADAAQIFCVLRGAWQIGTGITSLPQTISKAGPDGNTVVLDMSVPTETFATDAGYTVKATMTFNGTQFLAMWWTGEGAATKGYLIQGNNPMQKDGNTRLKYAQWDLTGASQSVKIYATQFVTASGFLVVATNSQSAGGKVGVQYTRATYDTGTKAIAAHSLRINPQQNTNTLGCQKDWFSGVVGGTLAAYHVTNTSPYSGALPVTDAAKDNTHMEGMSGLVDTATSTTGTPENAPATVAFDYSCNDLDTANAATGFFASGAVNYGALPGTIFPK